MASLAVGGVLADISWRLPFLIYVLSIFLIPLVIRFLNEPPRTPRTTLNIPSGSNRLIKIIFVNAIVLMTLFYILPTQLPFFLHQVGIKEGILSGTALAINALGMIISSLFFSRLKGLVHFTYVYAIAFLLMAIGYFITGMTYSFFIILTAMFIAGLGFGWLIANTNLWVIELTRPELRGRNMGVLTTCLFLGQFLSPIVFEPFVRWFDLSYLFSFAAVIMVIISLGFLGLGKSLIKMDNSTRL